MSVPGATIRAMPGDLERLPAVASGVGPAVLAAELLGRVKPLSNNRTASGGSSEPEGG